MNKLKFALRMIGAMIVPTLIFNATERLFPILNDCWLMRIWEYKGESVLGLLASGPLAGLLFVFLTYSIAPKWKIAITITMSSVMTALIVLSLIILFSMPKGLNWLHVIHTILAVVFLIIGMVSVFEKDKNTSENKSV